VTARPLARALAVAAVVAAAGGCGILNRAPQPGPQRGAWPEARDRETRAADLYDGFEHRARIWTVRLTAQVREERARRLAAWLGWTPAELEAKLAAERDEAGKWDDYVTFFYTADRKWNDLDALKGRSIWRVELELGGEDRSFPQVEALERDATFEMLFPMGDAFDTAYRLRFARTDQGPAPLPGVLRLASALGEMKLAYTPGSKPTPSPRLPEK
jgi:hypothetical protein